MALQRTVSIIISHINGNVNHKIASLTDRDKKQSKISNVDTQALLILTTTSFAGSGQFKVYIIESVDSISRDGPDCPYM